MESRKLVFWFYASTLSTENGYEIFASQTNKVNDELSVKVVKGDFVWKITKERLEES